jgi:hypothetical protein
VSVRRAELSGLGLGDRLLTLSSASGVHQIAVSIVQGGGEGGRWRVYCGAVTMGMAVALGRRSFVCRRRGRCWSHFCDSVIWVELTSLVKLDWSVGLIGLAEGEESLLVLWHVSVLMDC